LIPTFPKVKKFYLKVDFKRLNYPPERVLSCEYGLFSNQEYSDARGFNWNAFKENYQIEKAAIDYADKHSKTAKEFEEILERFNEDNNFPVGLEDLVVAEAGVSSIAIALAAFDCVPVTSCRGHPGISGKEDSSPHVAFWAKKIKSKELVSILNEYVLKEKDKHIGIDNAEIEGYGGLLLYANNIPSLMNFAKYLSEPFTSRSKTKKK